MGRSTPANEDGVGTSDRDADAPALRFPPMGGIIGYKLRRAQLTVFQDFLDVFSTMKLRPAEFSALALIGENPGQKQTAIADALGIKRANFVSLMDGLERRGLAERRHSESDRRSHSLHLTSSGTKFCREMLAVWRAHEDRFVAALGGPAARDQLIALLDRLLDIDKT